MFQQHSWSVQIRKVQKKVKKANSKTMGHEDNMDGVMDFLKDINDKYLKKPVQKAIDKNKQNLINSGINAVGKALDKVGANDPKALKTLQNVTSTITSSAVDTAKANVMDEVKKYIPWVIGGFVVLGGAVIYMKNKKQA